MIPSNDAVVRSIFCTILHTALWAQWQNSDQTLNSQQATYVSPSQASYGMPVVRILEGICPFSSGTPLYSESWFVTNLNISRMCISRIYRAVRDLVTECRSRRIEIDICLFQNLCWFHLKTQPNAVIERSNFFITLHMTLWWQWQNLDWTLNS